MVEPSEWDGQVRAIAEAQRRAWLSGQRVLLERYLPSYPQLRQADEALLDLICHELRLRELLGEQATVGEYVHRFPWLASQLEPLIQAYGAMASAFPETTLGFEVNDSLPAVPRRVDWPSSSEPFAVIDDGLDRAVVGPSAGESPRLGAIFYYPGAPARDASPDRPRLLREIGRGNLGIVYQALLSERPGPVALKLLLGGPYFGTSAWEQIERRVAQLRALARPHLATVVGSGMLGNLPYVAMEFAACGSLANCLDLGPRDAAEALRVARAIAAGLAALHESGIVHANLKPSNVLLSADGAWKLSDVSWSAVLPEVLNLPYLVDRPSGVANLADFARGHASVLQPRPHLALIPRRRGWRMGDARYLAPEAVTSAAGEISCAEDIYALGAMLYESLAGRPPFVGPTPSETLRQAASQSPPELTLPGAAWAQRVQEICRACLDRNPAGRPNAAELVAAFDRVAESICR